MSLDQELRRLFDDERLELPVRPDAVGERITEVPGNPDANYWLIVRDEVLTEVRLELKEQDCYR